METGKVAEHYNNSMTNVNESAAFLARIRNTLANYRMIEEHERVLVGVSGGADSVCLLLVLMELGYEVAAAHLNHGLRGAAADEDELFVERLAETLHISFFRKKVSLEGSLEAAGRVARKQFFTELADRHGFSKIAVAHSQDDRAETFLLHMLRGSGMEGLVSMAPVSGPTVRPLIETRRAEIETYLTARNQPWLTDATNFDLSFTRNRMRHRVIPQLAADFNINLVETLSRTVKILEGEDAMLQEEASDWISRHARAKDHSVVLDCRALNAAPPGLVRRVIRAALRKAGHSLHDVSFEHVEAIRGLVSGPKSGKLVQIPGGVIAVREFTELAIRLADPPETPYDYELQIPGRVHIPELDRIFRAEIVDRKCNESKVERVLLDARSLGPCVRIRNWKPGDYYRPMGLPAGKLKKLFQRARTPRSLRMACPVFVTDSSIVWVASFPVSRDFAPGEHSERLVAIDAFPA